MSDKDLSHEEIKKLNESLEIIRENKDFKFLKSIIQKAEEIKKEKYINPEFNPMIKRD